MLGYSDGQIRFFLGSTARYQNACNIAQQGSDPTPTSCIRFRPNLHPDLLIDDEYRLKYGGKTLLSVTCDGIINHWNAVTGKLQHSQREENSSFYTCDFSNDGLKYTVAGQDMAIHLYDEVTRQKIRAMTSNGFRMMGHASRVFCTKFHPEDPNIVISGGWDKIMKIYDTRVGKPVGQILGPMVSGDTIDIAGDEIVAGSNRHTRPLGIYSLSMQKVVTEIAFDPSNYAESGYIFATRFSRDRDHSLIFAGGAGRNELKVFDNDTDGNGYFKQLGTFSETRNAIMCLDVAPNGKMVAFGTGNGQIFVSHFSLTGNEEEPDLRSLKGRIAAANQRGK